MASAVVETPNLPLAKPLHDFDITIAVDDQVKSNMTPSAPADSTAIERGNALTTTDYIQSFISPEALSFSAKDGRQYTISVAKSTELISSELDQCFELIETYSRKDYSNSKVGWHPTDKRKEMLDPDMRYLLVREATTNDPSNQILAFTATMLTIEDSYPVIYIYEVHTSSSTRRTGLGRHLLSIAEGIGKRAGMSKSMLTVFCSNVGGEEFYRVHGYAEASTGPLARKMRSGRVVKPEYWIMEKFL